MDNIIKDISRESQNVRRTNDIQTRNSYRFLAQEKAESVRKIHSLLQKQINLASLKTGVLDVDKLLQIISKTYARAELQRKSPEKILPLTAIDLIKKNNQLKKQIHELLENKQRHELITIGENTVIWEYCPSTGYCYFSGKAADISAYKPFMSLNEWLGSMHPEDADKFGSHLQMLVDGSTTRMDVDYRFCREGHRVLWFRCQGTAERDSQGRTVRITGSQFDITQQKQFEQELIQAAFYDRLTNLPNRSLFMDRLQQLSVKLKRPGEPPAALLFIDLDRFKLINDTMGHEAGDELLIAVSRRIEYCLRPGDTVSRLGGDEFTVILAEIENEENALEIAKRIIDEISKPYLIQERTIFISASIGVELLHYSSGDHETLLRNADFAMYAAKIKGRSRVELFEQSHRERALNKAQLEHELKHALEEEEITLYYQPVINLETGRLEGFEALVRWLHPKKGVIYPGEFLEIAEESKLIIPIGHFIVSNVCRQLKKWNHSYGDQKTPFISINISGVQINDEKHLQDIFRLLDQYHLRPGLLKIEMKESGFTGILKNPGEIMNSFRSRGVELCIDDFGTGYSSITNLHNLPFDYLKIDRSFVSLDNQEKNQKNYQLIKHLISITRDLNIKTIAEGIETNSEFNEIRKTGCYLGQGYYFSKPLPIHDLFPLLCKT